MEQVVVSGSRAEGVEGRTVPSRTGIGQGQQNFHLERQKKSLHS